MTTKVMKGMTTLFIFINRPAIFKTSLSWFNSTRVYKRNQGVFSSPKKSIKIFHAKSLQIMEKRIRNNIKIRTALSVLDRAVFFILRDHPDKEQIRTRPRLGTSSDFVALVDDTGLEFARRPYQALPARTKQYQKALYCKGLGRSVVPTRTKAKQPVTTY